MQLRSFVWPLAGVVLLGACGDSAGPSRLATRATISGALASMQVGQTTQLGASAFDIDDVPLPDAEFTWTSSNEVVASVSPTGLVSALSPGGPVQILATTAGATASTTVMVSAAPALGFGSQNLTFVVPQGSTAITTQATAVLNIGGGALQGLALGPVTYEGSDGWVTSAELGSGVAPTTITVRVSPGVRAAGTYAATLPVFWGAAGAQAALSLVMTVQ